MRRTRNSRVIYIILPVWLLCLCLFLNGCHRPAPESPAAAMRPVAAPALDDDLGPASLVQALEQQIAYMKKETAGADLVFGPRRVPFQQYLAGLEKLKDEAIRQSGSPEELYKFIAREFDFYEVYGQKEWGDIHITSYFEPVIPGSLTRTDKFPQALYSRPDDLVSLDLALWDQKYSGERKLRGRLHNTALIPYYSREEIDSRGALNGRGLELCWVDPIDAFFLHIQGSGVVRLEDGTELKLNYAEKNGQPYRALGNFLKSFIPLKEMTANRIEDFLKTLQPQELQSYLNLNPSYVFFVIAAKNAVTASGIPASAGRTIATDRAFFPKKSLAFMQFDKPVRLPDGSFGTKKSARFVLDQDVGGAILGPGRVDLFWGRGDEAKALAGRVNTRGRLVYLVPKQASP